VLEVVVVGMLMTLAPDTSDVASGFASKREEIGTVPTYIRYWAYLSAYEMYLSFILVRRETAQISRHR
jgi:hypothetical protein